MVPVFKHGNLGAGEALYQRQRVTVGEGLSILMNVHIPHYRMSGVDYRVGYKTCRRQAGSPPSSPLQNRKSYFNKRLLLL